MYILRRSQRERAASLLDFMCGMMITAIGAMIATIGIQQQQDAIMGLRFDLNSLITHLQLAATSVRQFEEPAELIIREREYVYKIPGQDPATIKFSRRTSVKFGSDSELKINFYPSGTTTPVSINLTDGQQSCSIVIALYGRVRSFCT